ncbi:MAG: hypothetical protein K1000chlam3_01432 [Chlamydiae bacterium]|nr:hypothetical protein [Chlamydiota bacterium]
MFTKKHKDLPPEAKDVPLLIMQGFIELVKSFAKLGLKKVF